MPSNYILSPIVSRPTFCAMCLWIMPVLQVSPGGRRWVRETPAIFPHVCATGLDDGISQWPPSTPLEWWATSMSTSCAYLLNGFGPPFSLLCSTWLGPTVLQKYTTRLPSQRVIAALMRGVYEETSLARQMCSFSPVLMEAHSQAPTFCRPALGLG